MKRSSPPTVIADDRWQVTCALIAWSVLLGLLCWGPMGHPAASPLVFLVWGLARRRTQFALASLAYFLSSQVDLVSMPGRFYELGRFENILVGVGAWVTWSALGTAVFTACWHRRFPALSLTVGLVAITLPPVGWFVMANPLHAAGWWFPSSGIGGVLATIGIAFILAKVLSRCDSVRIWPQFALSAAVLSAVATNAAYQPPPPLLRLTPVDTHFGRFPVGVEKTWKRVERINELVAQVKAQGSSVVVLPEMVIGNWSPRTAYWLRPTIQATANSDLVVVFGAVYPPSSQDSRKPRNGFVLIQNGQANWRPGRIPMPGGDWHFGRGSFEASPWENSIVQLGSSRAALSICYEDALVWTHLQFALHQVDVHVSIASLWWAEDLPIDRRVRLMAMGWSRLAGVPMVRATNW